MASAISLMSLFSFTALLFLLLLPPQLSTAQNDVVKGGYWFPDSGLPLSDIDSTLFTHLFCAFAGLDPQTNRINVSAQCAGFPATVQLKNAVVKALLSIGGGSSSPAAFAAMASGPGSRKSFIDSSIQLARSSGFHGLDLDWEYPDTAAAMSDFGTLVAEWRAAVAAEAMSSGRPPLLLTAAVSYSPKYDSLNYPAQAAARSLDWVNAMAYDFSSPTRSPVTRSHAALYDPASELTGSYGVDAWVTAGLSKDKIVLGVPFYGYAWRLAYEGSHGLYAPAGGPARPEDNGSIGFNEIQRFIADKKAQVVYNETMVTAYCYSGTTWIGYDGSRTVATKAAYVKTEGLRGFFAWHVGADDNWVLSRAASQAL